MNSTYADAVDQTYFDLSQIGQPFSSLLAVPKDWYEKSLLIVSDSSEELRLELMRTRLTQAKLLSDKEWSLVEDFPACTYAPIEQLRWYRSTRHHIIQSSKSGGRNRIVIDIRAVILGIACGTRTHAREALTAFFRSAPAGEQVFAIGDLALLPAELRGQFAGEWDGDATNVKSFFQLAPFLYEPSQRLMPLYFDPHIRKVGIWLDGIMATNPYFYLSNARGFFNFQVGLETLNEFDRILTLSQFSARELSDTGIIKPDVVLSGCAINDLDDHTTCADDGDFILVLGNSYAHKNVLCGVLGALPFAQPRNKRIVVLANFGEDKRNALLQAIAQLGYPESIVDFKTELSDEELSRFYQNALITIVPSFHEGFSLPVTEALMAKSPVALSNIAAHKELLGDGEWFFQPEHPSSLTDSLTKLFEQSSRAQLWNEQYESFQNSYSVPKFDTAIAQTAQWLC